MLAHPNGDDRHGAKPAVGSTRWCQPDRGAKEMDLMLSVTVPEAEVTLGTVTHWVPLEPLQRAVVTVTGQLEGKGREADGAALLLVEFEPNVTRQEELANSGLFLSDIFGPFVYLQSSAELNGRFLVRFTPPFGRVPRRIGMRLFRSSNPLKVTDVKITTLAPDDTKGANAPLDVELDVAVARSSTQVSSAEPEELEPVQVQWLHLPDTIGNQISVLIDAGSTLDPKLQVAVDLEAIPKEAVLANNGLISSTTDNPYVSAPLGAVNGKGYAAVFSVPDNSVLKRVGLLIPNRTAGLSAVTVRRAIVSPREGDVLVNISVDTEALPGRAANDHVAKLIYGRVASREYGIPMQMRVFHELKVPATFYLECGQCALWGADTIADVGKLILDGGFDLQLHLHSELIARAHAWKWTKPVPPMLNNLDRSQTFRAVGFAIEQFHKVAGQLPSVFRAGAYLFAPHTLEALKEFGIKASSNYRADQRPKNAFDFDGPGPMRPFKWSNGILEFPITLSPEPLTALPPRECWRRILHHVQINGTWVVNVVIHSWSFMHRDKNGHQIWRNSELMDNLIKFIELAPSGVRFASIKEVVEMVQSGDVDIPLEKDIGALIARIA